MGPPQDNIVHRDIKPQNIFVGENDELILGDLGIVFLPNLPERVSVTGESVGPRDFMPPWILLNDQPGEIHPSFDAYMLGKVLWCMVAGRLKLHREDFLHPALDVVKQWPDNPDMHMVNTILSRCVVPLEQDCLTSAQDLYLMVGKFLEMMQNNGHVVGKDLPRRCQACGVGFYQLEKFDRSQPRIDPNKPVGLRFWSVGSSDSATLPVGVFVCNACGNLQFFSGSSSALA